MVIVLMGVSGAGKTTVGELLASELGWPFYDADAFHPTANIEAMRSGRALTDVERAGWLDALARQIAELVRTGASAVIACSALKHAYRDRLRREAAEEGGASAIRFVYLRGEPAVIRQRLEKRRHHFMPASLLTSQFEILEEPWAAVTVDVSAPPPAIVHRIRQALQI